MGVVVRKWMWLLEMEKGHGLKMDVVIKECKLLLIKKMGMT